MQRHQPTLAAALADACSGVGQRRTMHFDTPMRSVSNAGGTIADNRVVFNHELHELHELSFADYQKDILVSAKNPARFYKTVI